MVSRAYCTSYCAAWKVPWKQSKNLKVEINGSQDPDGTGKEDC